MTSAQRPERPAEDEGLSEGEQFARQIQSRILSALSSSIVEAITGSGPGSSAETPQLDVDADQVAQRLQKGVLAGSAVAQAVAASRGETPPPATPAPNAAEP